MAKKISDYLKMRGIATDIKIADIEINLYQVRTENVNTDQAELMHEMKLAGTNFQPILVCKSESETGYKYDLIYGQRRLNAADELKWETISAQIIDEVVPVHIGKAISYMENSHLRTPDSDLRSLIKSYRDDGYTQKRIHEELGIKKRDIQLVFWEEMLTPNVKKAAEETGVGVQVARQLQEKTEINGEVQEEKVIELLNAVKTMGDGARKQVVKAVGEDASLDAKQAVNVAKENMTNVDYKITLSKDEDAGLTKHAEDGKKSNEAAILDIVVERLNEEELI